ncbi:unnamed protein product [Rhizophagus irregularis]|nr:unnamed protein product [Rhizophagus irregularis]
MLNNRTERLVLKDKKFKCHRSASEETITKLFEIKKCNNPTCPYCKPIRLPSQEFHDLSFLPDPIPSQENTDHYAAFQSIYGTETTEEYRPTYMQSQANAEPIPKSILVVGKIRGYIDCEDCKKRRLHQFFPDDHYLKEVVFVRTRINCDSPIEVLYYSSCKSGNYPICYYCGKSEGLVVPPESLKQRFKQIYPLCEMCIDNRKGFHTKGEIKTNRRASKRHKT